MPEYGTKKPRTWKRTLGVMLAFVVAVGATALVIMTHEPKRAQSSPAQARAVERLPQIADAKTEAEILLRGKSSATLKRPMALPYSGEITKILVKEGQTVDKDEMLLEYKLDRQSMLHVQQVLYPDMVLTLKRNQYDRKVAIDKTRNATLPVKKLELERLEKELVDLRELMARGMAHQDAIKAKDRQIQAVKKEIFEIEETAKQQEADLGKINEDLKFYQEKQRRDLDLLEWQTNRSYSDSSLAMDVAYLKAPIAGNVIWLANELQVKAELGAGFQALTLAPMNPMVVRCKVHELDLVKLKMGDRGSATFDAIPDKKFPCSVTRIPWTSRNPALEVPADYDLECEMENPDGKVKDGLTCNVKVSVAE
jgi:multidrug resistance efflux pump